METTVRTMAAMMLALSVAATAHTAVIEGAGGSKLVAVAAAEGPDTDGDGLADSVEALLGTDPKSLDSDNDGIDDGYETIAAMDPKNADDAVLDFDADGLTNEEEYHAGASIHDRDTDADGYSDLIEVLRGTNPADAGDYPVSNVFGDIDADGRANAVDVQIVINAALGKQTDAPANVDGVDGVNAIDVQLVINAALGLR